ncbi:MAG: deoxyribose-phosphate aldolase [bacterium]|nr:deoxyribose-phosphate aldolase [bacterium]
MNAGIRLRDLAKMIDHSLLHPTLTDKELERGCEICLRYNVATACVKPYAVRMAAELLRGSEVGVCAVAGFPHGSSTIVMKQREIEEEIRDGAVEIDVVVNIGKVLGGDWGYVEHEIAAVNATTVGGGAILKVIFENDYLCDEHIMRLCEICTDVGVAFVKTSTGYGFVRQANGMYSYRGATDHHLKLMREHCGPHVQIKSAGGIRTLDDLLRVRSLGVTRSGATATVEILEEAKRRGYA